MEIKKMLIKVSASQWNALRKEGAKTGWSLSVSPKMNEQLIGWMENGIYDIGDQFSPSSKKSWFNQKMKDLMELLQKKQVAVEQAEELYELAKEESGYQYSSNKLEDMMDKLIDIGETVWAKGDVAKSQQKKKKKEHKSNPNPKSPSPQDAGKQVTKKSAPQTLEQLIAHPPKDWGEIKDPVLKQKFFDYLLSEQGGAKMVAG